MDSRTVEVLEALEEKFQEAKKNFEDVEKQIKDAREEGRSLTINGFMYDLDELAKVCTELSEEAKTYIKG